MIDVPFSTETAARGAKAVAAFSAAMTWLPAFARTIRRVHIESDNPTSFECAFSPLLEASAIDVVSVSGPNRERAKALRFDLSDGYSLLLRIDAHGPCTFPGELRRLWNLAPLEEDLRSAWLINGPFAVDPGRTGLAGSIVDRQEQFRKLGRKLGERLLELHDLANADWSLFAKSLDLQDLARKDFWSRLFNVLGSDFDDDLARHLHVDRHGYGHLAGEHRVVPTRLPSPFDGLVRVPEANYYTVGALADPAMLAKVGHWPTLMALQNRIVACEINEQLKKLGFSNAQPLDPAL